MTHILNRPAPPREPQPPAEKPTPEQAAVIARTQRTKATAAVWRAMKAKRS